MVKNNWRFFLYFKKFVIGFCWKHTWIRIDIVIHFIVQTPYLKNSCSWVKAFNQLDCRILWSHIHTVGITGAHWFFTYRQIARRRKNFNQIFHKVGCSEASQMLQCLKNSIEWKIKWRDFPCIFISKVITASPLLQSDSNVYQSAVNSHGSMLLFLCMLGDIQTWKVLKKKGILGLAGICVKWKCQWCFHLLLKLHNLKIF